MPNYPDEKFIYQHLATIINTDPELKTLALKKWSQVNLITYQKILATYLLTRNRPDAYGYYPGLMVTQHEIKIFKQTSAKALALGFEKELLRINHSVNGYLNIFKLQQLKQKAMPPTLSTATKKKAWTDFQALLTNKKKDVFVKGMYLFGYFNTYKTGFFDDLMLLLIKHQQKFLSLYVDDFLMLSKKIGDEGLNDFKTELLKTIPYLLFDNLTLKHLQMSFGSDVFQPLLNYRYHHGLPVIVNSNYSPNTIIQQLSTLKEGNIDKMRVIYQLQKMCHFYDFN